MGGGSRGIAHPQGVALGEDLVVGSTRLHAPWVVLGIPARDRIRIPLVDQEPGVARVVLERPGGGILRPIRPAPSAPAGSHDGEPASELGPVEPELELAVGHGSQAVGGLGFGLPRSPVPHDDVARSVLALRNDALEVQVLDRVILDMHRHASLAGIERRAARDRPRDQDAPDLQSNVVMQARGAMALDDKPTAPQPHGGYARRGSARGLRRADEVALAPVFLERHGRRRAAGTVPGPRRSSGGGPGARPRRPPPRPPGSPLARAWPWTRSCAPWPRPR